MSSSEQKEKLKDARDAVIQALAKHGAFIYWDNVKEELFICIEEIGSDGDITLYGD